MARRKKTTAKRKTSTTRRRSSRIGGIGSKAGFSNALPLLAGMALGAVGSAASDKLLSKVTNSPKLQGGAKILLGLYMSGSNSPVLRGVGLGMASAGTITVAHSFGLLQNLTAALNGIGEADFDSLNGIRQDAYVNGVNYDAYVNGISQDALTNEPSRYADNGCNQYYGMQPVG